MSHKTGSSSGGAWRSVNPRAPFGSDKKSLTRVGARLSSLKASSGCDDGSVGEVPRETILMSERIFFRLFEKIGKPLAD